VALLHERDDWFVDTSLENGSCPFRSVGSFLAVADAVNGSNEHSVLVEADKVVIARLTLAGKSELGNTIFHNRLSYGLHFFTATVVPRPGWEVISNSSIKRRTPGSPSPRLPEVEKPSRSA